MTGNSPRVPSPDSPQGGGGARRLLWLAVAAIVVVGLVMVYAPGCWSA